MEKSCLQRCEVGQTLDMVIRLRRDENGAGVIAAVDYTVAHMLYMFLLKLRVFCEKADKVRKCCFVVLYFVYLGILEFLVGNA